MKYATGVCVQLAQDGLAAQYCHAQFQSDSAFELARKRRACLQQGSRAFDLFQHEYLPQPARVPAGNLRFGNMMRGQLVLGQINAIFLIIHRDVLQKIDQLQTGTNRIGIGQVSGNVVAIQMQHQSPDGIGRAATVIDDFRQIGVALFFNVLRKSRNQITKGLYGYLMLLNLMREPGKQLLLRNLPVLDNVELGNISSQIGKSRGSRRVTFVRYIVCRSSKRINGFHRSSQLFWQQQRGNREIFVMINRHRQ